MGRVFLNVDAAERDDEPGELFAIAQVVSIACGGHAGDDASMRRAIARAGAGGSRVGAHPSYPDRTGFGRRAMVVTPEEARAFVRAQVGQLAEHATQAGVRV